MLAVIHDAQSTGPRWKLRWLLSAEAIWPCPMPGRRQQTEAQLLMHAHPRNVSARTNRHAACTASSTNTHSNPRLSGACLRLHLFQRSFSGNFLIESVGQPSAYARPGDEPNAWSGDVLLAGSKPHEEHLTTPGASIVRYASGTVASTPPWSAGAFRLAQSLRPNAVPRGCTGGAARLRSRNETLTTEWG